LCENSGYDLAELGAGIPGKRLYLLSYRMSDELTARGKGYGELDLIVHALEAARPCTLLKVTGRYYVQNMGQVVESIRAHPDASVITSAPDPPHGIPAQCFYAAAGFLERYLAPCRDRIDDRSGFWFEHALEAAIADAVRDGHRHAIFPRRPRLLGISGSGNLPVGIRPRGGGCEIPLTPDYRAFLLSVVADAPEGDSLRRRLSGPGSADLERVPFSAAELALLRDCLGRRPQGLSQALLRLLDQIPAHPNPAVAP
jgi:hypothetical protein